MSENFTQCKRLFNECFTHLVSQGSVAPSLLTIFGARMIHIWPNFRAYSSIIKIQHWKIALWLLWIVLMAFCISLTNTSSQRHKKHGSSDNAKKLVHSALGIFQPVSYHLFLVRSGQKLVYAITAWHHVYFQCVFALHFPECKCKTYHFQHDVTVCWKLWYTG